jgi:hypothetical protein
MMNKKNALFSTAFLILTCLLEACGSSPTDLVRINFLTGSDSGEAKNIMSSITTFPPVVQRDLAGGFCIQKGLYAGIQLQPSSSGNNAQVFEVYPTNIITQTMNSAADPVSWLSTSKGGSVDIPVTHGATVGFGVIGDLVSSATAAAGDNCEFMTANTPNTAYSVVGHRDGVTITDSMQVNLGVWVLNASQTPAPDTTGSCNNSNGNNSSSCSKKDFYNVKCTGCGSSFYNYVVRFDYFQGQNRADHPVQYAQITSSGAFSTSGVGISIPSIDVIKATLLTPAGAEVANLTENRSTWQGTNSVNLSFNYTVSSQTATLTFSQY